MIGELNPLAQELTPFRFWCIRSALIKSVTEFAIHDLDEPIGLICKHLEECIIELDESFKVSELCYYLSSVAYWSKVIREFSAKGYDIRDTWRHMVEQLQICLNLLSITYDIEVI
jgi:hypothetical protein